MTFQELILKPKPDRRHSVAEARGGIDSLAFQDIPAFQVSQFLAVVEPVSRPEEEQDSRAYPELRAGR
jgi:hypothetical protein